MLTKVSTLEFKKDIRSIYLDILDEFNDREQDELVLTFYGDLTAPLIEGFANAIYDNLLDHEAPLENAKKIYSIAFEGMQNTILHGVVESNLKDQAIFCFGRTSTGYQLIFGNKIQTDEKDKLENYLTSLNQLDQTKLEDKYRETIFKAYVSEKSGGGLGLLLMRLKSKSKIDYQFFELPNQLLFFQFQVDFSLQ